MGLSLYLWVLVQILMDSLEIICTLEDIDLKYSNPNNKNHRESIHVTAQSIKKTNCLICLQLVNENH